MRLSVRKSLLVGMLVCQSAWGNPLPVGPPAMVDGKPVPMPVVKKFGQYWYPASLVGHNMGVEFSFDHATNTLYVDGSRLDMDTVVVDGVVFIPIKPRLRNGGMEPGMEMLKSRRQQYEAYEKEAPERAGNTEAMFMHTKLDVPHHPWEEDEGEDPPMGPVINLEPTGESVPVPGTTRPQEAPKPLPNRVSRIPAVAPPELAPALSVAASYPGQPYRVSTQGGPQGGPIMPAPPTLPAIAVTSSPTGLQPIPSSNSPVPRSLKSNQARNQAFELSVLEGAWRGEGNDRLLILKLRQTNLSPVTQANLGAFSLRCRDGSRLEPVESRSSLSLTALPPGGSRDGELVFRLGPSSSPASLELEGSVPLSLALSDL